MNTEPEKPRSIYRQIQLRIIFGLLVFLGILAMGSSAGQFTNEEALTEVLTEKLGLDPEPDRFVEIGGILRRSRERHARINAVVGGAIVLASAYGLLVTFNNRR